MNECPAFDAGFFVCGMGIVGWRGVGGVVVSLSILYWRQRYEAL